MEFIQIGLSSTKTKLACSGTMLRAMPRIINSDGEEFLKNYFPKNTTPSEICNILFAKGASWPISYEEKSHIIDIAVFKEINLGKKVYLDYNATPEGNSSHFEEVPLDRLKIMNPEILYWLKKGGIDLESGVKLEISPAVLHFLGGVMIWE
jgi:succinate dehydrogenase / fumarate reductase flavoprotein subunit